MTEVTSDQQKCLTNGHDFLWVYADDGSLCHTRTWIVVEKVGLLEQV